MNTKPLRPPAVAAERTATREGLLRREKARHRSRGVDRARQPAGADAEVPGLPGRLRGVVHGIGTFSACRFAAQVGADRSLLDDPFATGSPPLVAHNSAKENS